MITKEEQWALHAVTAQAWIDGEFRKRYLQDPRKVLSEHGIEIPEFVDVSVKEGTTRGRIEFPLPPKPDVSDDAIKKLVVDHPDPCF